MKIDLVEALKKQGIVFEDGQEKVIAELSTAVEKAMETQNSTFENALKTALDERIGLAEKDDNNNVVTIMTKMKEVAEQVELLGNKTAIKLSEVEKYQLKKTIEKDHAKIVDAIKNKTPYQIEFKAAAIHLTTNGTVTNDAGLDFPVTDNVLVDNDIAKIRYPENFILNVIPNTQVANVPAQRIRKEQAPKEGAVAVTVEGAVKPLNQYKFVRTSTDRVKYAGRIEWSEEFEMDFMALFAEIINLFEQDVIRTWQNGLVTTITTNATAYVSSVLDGTFPQPDNGLAVVAGQSQLQALNYSPDIVLMNPADLVATLFVQNTDGDLKLTPYINTTAGTINGMRLVQSNTIAQGFAYVGESRLYREQHSNFIMRTGQYGNQLIENEYTAIGEVFSIMQIAERDLVGWVELDLDAVKTALQQA